MRRKIYTKHRTQKIKGCVPRKMQYIKYLASLKRDMDYADFCRSQCAGHEDRSVYDMIYEGAQWQLVYFTLEKKMERLSQEKWNEIYKSHR